MKLHPLSVLLSTAALTAALSSAPVLAQSDPHAGHHPATATPAAQTSTKTYSTRGVVKSVFLEKKRAMIEHEAIAELQWPVMTMPFEVPDTVILNALKAGERIDFKFQLDGQGRSMVINVDKAERVR